MTTDDPVDQALAEVGLTRSHLTPDGVAVLSDAIAEENRQLTRSDIADMPAEAIVAAKAAGRLDELLGKSTP